MTTRSRDKCIVFGYPKLLSGRVLPTFKDVMCHYLFVQHDLKERYAGKDPSVCEILKQTVPKIEEIWLKASIPVVSKNRIWDKIKKFQQRYKLIQRNLKSRQDTQTIELKLDSFKEEASKLFDIAACKCEFQTCKCEKSKKVPQREQAFLADQRTKRVMAIGTVDIKVTTKIAKTMNRKNCSFKKEDPKPSCSYSDVPEKILEFSTSGEENEEEEVESDSSIVKSLRKFT